MARYEPVLTANVGKPDSHTLKVYEAGGGYRALRKAMKEKSPKDVLEGFALDVELQYRTGNLSAWSLAEPGLQIDDTIGLSPGGGFFGSPFYINVQTISPTLAGLHEMNVTARITGLPGGAAPFGGFSKLMFDFDSPDLVNVMLGITSASPGLIESVPCRFQVYVPG